MTRCTHNANYVCPECEQKRAALPSNVEELRAANWARREAIEKQYYEKGRQSLSDADIVWLLHELELMQERASTPTEKEAGELSANAKQLLLEGSIFTRGWVNRAVDEIDDERVRLIGFEMPEGTMTPSQELDALREIKAAAISRARSASVTDAEGCGCVYCDLGLDPDVEVEGVKFHHAPRRGNILCERKREPQPMDAFTRRSIPMPLLKPDQIAYLKTLMPTPPAHGEGE